MASAAIVKRDGKNQTERAREKWRKACDCDIDKGHYVCDCDGNSGAASRAVMIQTAALSLNRSAASVERTAGGDACTAFTAKSAAKMAAQSTLSRFSARDRGRS